MKILYDISVLGLGFKSNSNRAGIYRVIENMAQELALSEEIDLEFCASEFNGVYTHEYCLQYLESSLALSHVGFNYPRKNKIYYATINKLRRGVIKAMEDNKDSYLLSLPYKASYKITTYLSKIADQIMSPIATSSLHEADIYHSTVFEIPRIARKHCRGDFFLTVYDLIPILYPDFFEVQPKHQHFIKGVIDNIRSNDWVVCISESTKNDLCSYKNIDPGRVFVSHLAADRRVFYPCSSLDARESILRKYQIPDTPYFLGLSTLEPRKNIAHTIRSFLNLIQQEQLEDLNLVLVGAKGWKYQEIFETISCDSKLAKRVIFTGYVHDDDLAAIYSHAIAFIFMSFYEGFGLPPLEAMSCGTPVITSNTSSLPEVVDGAGIMLSPTDSDELCYQMLQVYQNKDLRQEMSNNSLKKSQMFSWEKSCQDLIKYYNLAISSR